MSAARWQTNKYKKKLFDHIMWQPGSINTDNSSGWGGEVERNSGWWMKRDCRQNRGREATGSEVATKERRTFRGAWSEGEFGATFDSDAETHESANSTLRHDKKLVFSSRVRCFSLRQNKIC